jgi:hypothetical protein
MSRLGSEIDNIFCDKFKGKLDPNASYTTDSLIDALRNDADFKFEDFVAWLFGGADWVGNSSQEATVVSKLNEFCQNNPSPRGGDVAVISCTSEQCKTNFWVHYGYGVSEEQQEIYKQALCDLFHS